MKIISFSFKRAMRNPLEAGRRQKIARRNASHKNLGEITEMGNGEPETQKGMSYPTVIFAAVIGMAAIAAGSLLFPRRERHDKILRQHLEDLRKVTDEARKAGKSEDEITAIRDNMTKEAILPMQEAMRKDLDEEDKGKAEGEDQNKK